MNEASDLPLGWSRVRLNDILEEDGLFDGPFGSNLKSNDYTESGVRVIRLENLANLRFVANKATFVSDAKYATLTKHTVVAGDILVGSFVDGAVRVCVLPELPTKAIAKADCFTVRTRTDVADRRFIAFQLGAQAIRDTFIEDIHGATRPRITTKQLRNCELVLPPIAEQHRIVEKISRLLSKVSEATLHLDSAVAALAAFRQGVFEAAATGELTREWRDQNRDANAGPLVERLVKLHVAADSARRGNAAEPTDGVHDLDEGDVPERWRLAPLVHLCEVGRPITYGILKPGPDTPDGVPYVRVADFPNNRLELSRIKRTTATIAQAYRRSTLRTGDVLLSIRGTFGRVCRVPTDLNGANITQDTARLSIDPSIDADYIIIYLSSRGAQGRLRRSAKGAAVHGVNIGDVRALQAAVPPFEEQREIVRKTNDLMRAADAIEHRIRMAARRAHALPQAVLAKAFAGELS